MAKRINPRTMRAIAQAKLAGHTTDQCVARFGVSKSTVERAIAGHRHGTVAHKIIKRKRPDDVELIVQELLTSMTATMKETLSKAVQILVRRKVDKLLTELAA